MLVLDNSVLSAFTKLDLLAELGSHVKKGLISWEILKEHSQKWESVLPEWINVVKPEPEELESNPPASLSRADISGVFLSTQFQCSLASDDLDLRKFATSLDIKITGSLGLLKAMYLKNIIKNKGDYYLHVDLLRTDVYFTEDLYEWARDVE